MRQLPTAAIVAQSREAFERRRNLQAIGQDEMKCCVVHANINGMGAQLNG